VSQEELDVLNNCDEWLNYPIMPLVNRKTPGWPKTGLVLAVHRIRQDSTRTVYEVNMFDLKSGPLGPQLENVTKHTYPNYEAMLADGWEVD
jgi:hypothetical protein